MRKLRVYELARHYGVDSKQIMALLQKMKVEAKSHMSVVEDDAVDKVHAVFQRKRQLARENYAKAHNLNPDQLKNVAALKPLEKPEAPEEPKQSWFQRLTSGLSKTSNRLSEGITSVFTKRKLDATTLDDLEDILIQAETGCGKDLIASVIHRNSHRHRFPLAKVGCALFSPLFKHRPEIMLQYLLAEALLHDHVDGFMDVEQFHNQLVAG